ncbi:hypothetical protein GGS23DRAFT_593104 [Durotheca rogersii]|uniref:uncharacterized protein n=1 Tax=Durotheca rogersii TaxID=419775 RepID=UPI00221FB4AE|nr:uncharacterized protein GGS23DRAFT_593104 [Durotheca rogersii]KAI5867836.1 hypothetical protein GGS23DRAFT_593104 [Durotheca rogersii]
MSEHPYRYGHYPGQQVPPNPYFYNQPLPPPPNTQLPYHGPLHPPNITTENYAVVNTYQHNANGIPGLGLGNSFQIVPYPQPETTATRSSQLQTVVPSREENSTLEEGELSEGEFEDLYEPKVSNNAPSIPNPPPPRAPSIIGNRQGSVGDADGSSIYDSETPRGEVITNSTSTSLPAPEREYSPGAEWERADQERERSGSYSPYLSPREIQRKAPVTKATAHGSKQPHGIQTTTHSIPGVGTEPSPQHSAEDPFSNDVPLLSSVATGHATVPTVAPNNFENNSPFISISEAKRKAQEAILGLWPFKVRYQDYIKEGFDEKLMKGLFMDLGLDTSMPRPVVVPKTTDEPQVPTATVPDAAKDVNKPQDATDQTETTSKPKQTATAKPTINPGPSSDTKTTEKSAAEERKDKIARKLAAKAQKSTASVPVPTLTRPHRLPSDAVNTAASAAASPAKNKTRAENNAILHQKLAALKKAQEKAQEKAEAEKLVADSPDKPPTPPGVSTALPAVVSAVHNNAGLSASSPVVAIPASGPDQHPVPTERSVPKEGGIPGLFLSTPPAQALNRTLKRPVASDFDNYPVYSGSLKRSRTQETLIIDVSDDEDVEMDIGSPIDEPNSSTEVTSPLQQTSLGSFPPLSDPTNGKQRSSPASSAVPTPPLHGPKLDLLHKRIEEMKRMIAEAEVKKASKMTRISQSPQAQTEVSESILLLKESEASEVSSVREEIRKVSFKRRDRIASHELPVVEATLKEQQEKLRQVVSEAAQLELEIQASIERRHKLTAEMEQLEGSLEAVPVETNTESESISYAARSVASEPDQVAESQPPDEQQMSPGRTLDVQMTDGEYAIEQDTEVVSDGIQPILDSSLPGTGVPEKVLAPATVSELQKPNLSNEEQANAAHDKTAPGAPSTDGLNKDDGDGFGPMAAAADTHTKPEGRAGVDTSELLPAKILSPIPDSPREPHPTPTSLTHIVPLPGPEDDTSRLPPPHAESNLRIEEQVNDEDELEEEPTVENLLSYHSPLGYFRAFRFHPRFFDEVSGGLKSMTYSSRIDPMRPLCPRVLSGEQCPDGNACEFQHFDTMVVPDPDIITELGSSDIFTGETRTRFVESLKRVLGELKANRVRDFDRITKAIVKHRREFLEDKTKVLPLDSGTS